jgi:hypothetical protein
MLGRRPCACSRGQTAYWECGSRLRTFMLAASGQDIAIIAVDAAYTSRWGAHTLAASAGHPRP